MFYSARFAYNSDLWCFSYVRQPRKHHGSGFQSSRQPVAHHTAFFLPNADELLQIALERPIQPGESRHIRFPWGFINRVIFGTNTGNAYFQRGFPASSNADTIRISRARKEFGRTFYRIHGPMPIGVRNNSSVNIARVHVTGEGMPEGDILGNDPLMPDELLMLWVQSGESYALVFFDTDGFSSDTVLLAANTDTVYRVSNSMFFQSGTVHSPSYPGYGITIANCIPSGEIVSIEVYDEEGFEILFFDLYPQFARELAALEELCIETTDTLQGIPDGSVNTIIAAEVMEHLDSPSSFLTEFKRLLAPGGRLMVSLPTENLLYRTGRFLAGFHRKEDYHVSELEGIVKQAVDTGFFTTHSSAIPNLIFALYKVYLFSITQGAGK